MHLAPDAGSAQVDIDGVDVVITPSGTTAYLGFTSAWAQSTARFAEIGGCASESDAVPTGPTCFESLRVAGVELTSTYALGAANPYRGRAVTSAGVLELVACGHEVTVPITPRPLPTVDGVAIDDQGADAHVTWSQSPDATSSLVGVSGGFGLASCHTVGGAAHVFANHAGVTYAEVTAMTAPDVFDDTPLGRIRIWYGAVATTAR